MTPKSIPGTYLPPPPRKPPNLTDALLSLLRLVLATLPFLTVAAGLLLALRFFLRLILDPGLVGRILHKTPTDTGKRLLMSVLLASALLAVTPVLVYA